MSNPTHVTVVVTVALGNANEHDVENAIRKALQALNTGFATTVVGCDWAPDVDLLADATGVDYDDIVLLDLNPTRAEA